MSGGEADKEKERIGWKSDTTCDPRRAAPITSPPAHPSFEEIVERAYERYNRGDRCNELTRKLQQAEANVSALTKGNQNWRLRCEQAEVTIAELSQIIADQVEVIEGYQSKEKTDAKNND